VTLLNQYRAQRRLQIEEERLAIKQRLLERFATLPTMGKVWAYGSATQPDRFHEDSDVDLAIEYLPTGISLYLLQSLLSEAAGCEVDVTILCESRLCEKILREGERWT